MMYSVNQELVDRLSIAPDAFTGQTALVTGGARGIGEATATTLAALGARVVVIDRLPSGEDVAAAIRAAGGDAVFKACDISDVDQLNDVIAQIGKTVGAVDGRFIVLTSSDRRWDVPRDQLEHIQTNTIIDLTGSNPDHIVDGRVRLVWIDN